ncbi:MAG TPA: amidohydrolase [Roseiarcus sp.]|nr:amidohydrolase [Roseiarcus sp.]
MAFGVGLKYQQFNCSNGCLCGNPEQWAGVLSRRKFLAVSAATPMLLTASESSGATAQSSDEAAAASKSRIPPGLSKAIAAAIDADADRLVGIYKDIHQHPELGFMEVRTSDIIAKQLKALGFEVTIGIGKTGVVGALRNGEGPTLMYRADMDANAVEEATGLPFASRVRVQRDDGTEAPVAHMCGHDAHVTWMLGMARAMASAKDAWSGTLILVGQPAEELILGARAMVDDGLYSRRLVPVPDHLVALHTAPIPTGVVAARGGTIMAGTDQIDVTFHGIGGHGSMPQLTKDPVIMGSMAVVQYQMILSRVLNPLDTAVLTVGSFQAGSDNNVIPENALLKLNLRFFDLKVRDQMIAGVKTINDGIGTTYGMPEERMPAMVMKGFSPPLVNTESLVEKLKPALREMLGERNVATEFPPATGSEDVHILKGDNPNVEMAFIAVGIADPALFTEDLIKARRLPFSPHNPDFRVDLAAIPLGARIATLSVMELMVKA